MLGIYIQTRQGTPIRLHCGDQVHLRLERGFLFISAVRNGERLLLGGGPGKEELPLQLTLSTNEEYPSEIRHLTLLIGNLLMASGFSTISKEFNTDFTAATITLY